MCSNLMVGDTLGVGSGGGGVEISGGQRCMVCVTTALTSNQRAHQ